MNSALTTYKTTLRASYIGFLVQATVINLTPVLFIPLREQFSLSFGQLGLLVLINFITQVVCDLAFSHAVDRHGYRRFLVGAHIFVVLGLFLFSLSPLFMKTPYHGFIAGTVLFSAGGGLLELLLSPTVNAIPLENKSTSMSLLHSFYAWGQAGVVIITTLLIFALGRTSWPFVMIFWAIPPAINAFLFSRVPFAPSVPEHKREGFLKHIANSFFIVSLIAIALGAASELIMSQWSSAYLERVMFIPKALGDISGMAMFAIMLGLGRVLHGKYGKKLDLVNLMITGTITALICYLVVAFSTLNILSLIACALCGMAVSLLWPGILVLSSEKFPMAGTWLFAFLAASGDIGASVGPWIVGVISDNATSVAFIAKVAETYGMDAVQTGMRTGILVAALFPLGTLLCLLYIKKTKSATHL